MRTHRALVGAAVLSTSLAAQTVWSMGSPWTDLAAVIAAAAPGDLVLLNGLTFAPFALNKGLTIVGPGVITPASSSPQYQLTTLTIPAGERARVVDVDFLPFSLFPVLHGVAASGTVTFEDCRFGDGAPHSLSVNGTTLVQRCTFTPQTNTSGVPYGGLRVQGGVCWITDCTLAGGPGHFSPAGIPYVIAATAALRVEAGTVHVSNCTLVGGIGATGGVFGTPVPGEPAVAVVGGELSISDCVLTGGDSPAGGLPGAAALASLAGTTVYARASFTGGAGSPAGPQTTGIVSLVPELVGMAMPQPFRLGASAQFVATAGTAQPLALFAAIDPAPMTHPVVIGPILGGASPLIPLQTNLPQPAAQIVRIVNVPNQPVLLGSAFYAQAVQLDGAQLRASAAVGGVVY